MNEIEKLLRRVSPHDKIILLETLRAIKQGDIKKLRVEKLSNSDFYKTRKGNFRIVFYLEGKAGIVVSIRRRNEKTYRNL